MLRALVHADVVGPSDGDVQSEVDNTMETDCAQSRPFLCGWFFFFYRFPVAVLVVRGGKYHHAKVRR